MTYSQKKEYVDRISTAKQAVTKISRVTKAVDMLAGKETASLDSVANSADDGQPIRNPVSNVRRRLLGMGRT